MSVTRKPAAIDLMLEKMPTALQAEQDVIEKIFGGIDPDRRDISFLSRLKTIDKYVKKLHENMSKLRDYQDKAAKLERFLTDWSDFSEVQPQEDLMKQEDENSDAYVTCLSIAGCLALEKIMQLKTFFENDLQVKASVKKAQAPPPLGRAMSAAASVSIDYKKMTEEHPRYMSMDQMKKIKLTMTNMDSRSGKINWKNIYEALLDEASAVSTPVRVEESSQHLLDLEEVETAINQCVVIFDEKNAYQQEGIFRISGRKSVIDELKQQFMDFKGNLLDQLRKSSNDDIASFLKWLVSEINNQRGSFKGSNEIKRRIAAQLEKVRNLTTVERSTSRLTLETFDAATSWNFSDVIIKFGRKN